MNKVKIADLLNKLKWDEKYDFSKVRIYYISRGMVDDTDFITGNDIKSLGKLFIETERGYIPYHRIIKIEYEGKKIYER